MGLRRGGTGASLLGGKTALLHRLDLMISCSQQTSSGFEAGTKRATIFASTLAVAFEVAGH